MHGSSNGLTTTMLDCADQQLRALANACAFSPGDIAEAARLLSEISDTWGARRLGEVPRWSGVTDDCSPLEFSIGISPHHAPELRFVLEAQCDPATPQSYWAAAEELNIRLERDHGAYLDRLRTIADLVRPSDNAYFAMLHGVVLRPGRQPLFKVYLNPQSRGPLLSRMITAEAFARFGLQAAWQAILAILAPDDELQFIALDLSSESNARVKLYVRHRHAFPADFERALRIADNNVANDLHAFITELFPAGESSASRPATTMYAATLENTRIDAAFSVATYPFIGSDGVAFARISNLLRRFELPTDAYARSVAALTRRPLHDERGLHNYVSFQNRDGERRVTVYLTPRMYLERLGPIGFDPVSAWPTPVGMLVTQS